MSTSRSSAPMARRIPISRVLSVTETSMMFMIPMPPTRRLTAATAARSVVMMFVVEATFSAISAVSSNWKLSSSSAESERRSRMGLAEKTALHGLQGHHEKIVLVAPHGGASLGGKKTDHAAGEASRADARADHRTVFTEEFPTDRFADYAHGRARLNFPVLEIPAFRQRAVVDVEIGVRRADDARRPVPAVPDHRDGSGSLRRHPFDPGDLRGKRPHVGKLEVGRAHRLTGAEAHARAQRQLIVPEGFDLFTNRTARAVADRHHRDDRRDADDDAEDRQKTAHRNARDLADGKQKGISDHGSPPTVSEMSSPSRKSR